MPTAPVPRHHVVQRQIAGGLAAVLAHVPVAGEDLAPGEAYPRSRPPDVVLEPDHARGAERALGGRDVGMVVLDHLGLRSEDEAERPSNIADVEGLVIRVQQQYDAIHDLPERVGTRRASPKS